MESDERRLTKLAVFLLSQGRQVMDGESGEVRCVCERAGGWDGTGREVGCCPWTQRGHQRVSRTSRARWSECMHLQLGRDEVREKNDDDTTLFLAETHRTERS